MPGAIGFLDAIINVTNRMLSLVGETLKTFGSGNAVYGMDYMTFARDFEPVFRAFAYAFCLLFIGVNLMESAVSYDLFSLKGAIKIFSRCLFAKILIDMAGKICVWIVELGTAMANEIIKNTAGASPAFPDANVGTMLPTSEIPVVGLFVDLILGILYLLPLIFVTFATAVICFLVMIKLVLRTFELTMLVSVSPIFFACWAGGDVTKTYLKKFILTFTGVVMQVVFMALVYAVSCSWISLQTNAGSGSDLLEWFVSLIPWTIIVISMGIMMIKPPKILTHLIS